MSSVCLCLCACVLCVLVYVWVCVCVYARVGMCVRECMRIKKKLYARKKKGRCEQSAAEHNALT